ncbi:MAG: hypothetical protein HKL96_13360 [Phycisphaerales bacterium]|nr:hypothetical protein [Phycisphaerales bacterium]
MEQTLLCLPMMRFSCFIRLALCCGFVILALPGCSLQRPQDSVGLPAMPSTTLVSLRQTPLSRQQWRSIVPSGHVIGTRHYRLYTTLASRLERQRLGTLLEADYRQFLQFVPQARPALPMIGFVFANRAQWADFSYRTTGVNAQIYMDIVAGGYTQDGVFATYRFSDAGMLSVVAHEAWHQFSFLALRNRLPAWLDEGMATQYESFTWQKVDGIDVPQFNPWLNRPRWLALRSAVRRGPKALWTLRQLIRTQAGAVVTQPQSRVNAYYGQIWSLGLFLEHSRYRAGLLRLLAAAKAGSLTEALANSGLTSQDVATADIRWNSLAGPIYFRRYISSNIASMQKQYSRFIQELTAQWPPAGSGQN